MQKEKIKNAALTEKYKELRKREEKLFYEKYRPVIEEAKEYFSPSHKYKLVIIPCEHVEKKEKRYWNYSKGLVFDLSTGEEIFTIIRNYGHFPFHWVEHKNGNEYLLCGEDYQGYVCFNLTEKKKHVYFPEGGFNGWGFCWINIDSHDSTLIVEGCYWGAQFEIVQYDFSNPDELPYPEISRSDVESFDDDDDDDDDDD
jgi:hypothetical protein